MAGTNKKLTSAVEAYFSELGRVHASGGATDERSTYGTIHGLLSAAGAALRPKVHCVLEPADLGAGHPDFALYAARQMQKGRAREGQLPEWGVVEVKPLDDEPHGGRSQSAIQCPTHSDRNMKGKGRVCRHRTSSANGRYSPKDRNR